MGLFCLPSCKPSPEMSVEDNARTDSLMNVLNSPELKSINQKLLHNPNDAHLYIERAKLYLQLKQLEEAINDTRRALSIDTTNADFYLTQADIFFAANETRNAKEVLEKIVKKFPENTDGLLKLAELLYFVKQYDKAFANINKALKLDETIAKAYYLKGSMYKELGDTTKAVSSLETAIEQDNRHYGAFLDLGLIYAARKNTLAFEYYDNALAIKPLSTEALYAKAKLLQDLDKVEEAIGYYQRILTIDSLHTYSLYNLGALELNFKKNTTKAATFFTKAITINPTYAEAYFARGVCYQELKENQKAYQDYNTCLQLKPNYGPAVEGLNSLGK